MSFTDKAKNAVQKAKGKVKKAAGKVTDNERLKAEGKADQSGLTSTPWAGFSALRGRGSCRGGLQRRRSGGGGR